MKKPYILFAAGLVVLILAFTFTQSYLTKLETDTKTAINGPVTKGDLDELREEVGEKLSEQQEHLLARLDSLEQRIRSGMPEDTVSVEPIVAKPKPAEKPAVTPPQETTSTTSTPERSGADSVAEAKAKSLPSPPSEMENVIYVRYAKARWALAPNLTNYELNTAKANIMAEIGKDYEMSAEEILQIIDKVYEYRKALRSK